MKKIAIVGFGLEGRALLEYFKDKAEVHIFDENKTLLEQDLELGCDYFFHSELVIPVDFETIYKTPGIPLWKIKIENSEAKVSSLTNLFLEKVKGKVIGITGTKGKSTVTSLIYKILKDAGLKVQMIGNIGLTANLDELEDSGAYFVSEMSSYQCQDLQKSPDIAVFTSFFPDHLDYHLSLENYFAAKHKITEFQSPDNWFVTIDSLSHTPTKAKKVLINTKNLDIKTPEKTEPTLGFETKLIGEHNQVNCALALAVSQIMGISEIQARLSIASYEPLSGRLEKIIEKSGVVFYEDALATIPEATWAAIEGLKNVDTIILGGQDRGIEFQDFAKKLATTQIRNFIIFPDTGEKMVEFVSERNLIRVKNMEECVQAAYRFTSGICLLSTASPSYNLFKNYKDRSSQYRYWIEKLG